MDGRVLFLSILMLFAVPALAETALCNIRREKAISFSEDNPTDKIIVTIRGRTCDTALERIRIVGSAGNLLYQYSEPLRNHFTRKINKADTERAMEVILGEDQFQSTRALLVWQPKEQYYAANSQNISVSQEYYKDIRKRGWRTFSHQMGYEGYRIIVYDREQKKAIEVSSGSP
jgi:hypothetical protein